MAAGAAADESGADGVLDWTKRHILERIAVDGATPRLLGLLPMSLRRMPITTCKSARPKRRWQPPANSAAMCCASS
ncbi:hypothetical protein MOP88_12120 [Sphingomonas sp. WKB10]|nr:hypothetical protein [Sphingomonas sp. WKB10]